MILAGSFSQMAFSLGFSTALREAGGGNADYRGGAIESDEIQAGQAGQQSGNADYRGGAIERFQRNKYTNRPLLVAMLIIAGERLKARPGTATR